MGRLALLHPGFCGDSGWHWVRVKGRPARIRAGVGVMEGRGGTRGWCPALASATGKVVGLKMGATLVSFSASASEPFSNKSL